MSGSVMVEGWSRNDPGFLNVCSFSIDAFSNHNLETVDFSNAVEKVSVYSIIEANREESIEGKREKKRKIARGSNFRAFEQSYRNSTTKKVRSNSDLLGNTRSLNCNDESP